jgi:hypothetical protein
MQSVGVGHTAGLAEVAHTKAADRITPERSGMRAYAVTVQDPNYHGPVTARE